MDEQPQQPVTRSVSREITERVTWVEARMEAIAEKQDQTTHMITQQNTLLQAITERQNDLDMTASAIRERTDQHAKTIEHLQRESVDVGKVLAAMKVQVDLLKYVGTAIGACAIGYLFSHLIK